MSDDPLLMELGAATTLTFNRPEKQNAMTTEMGHRLADAVEQINASAEPRVVLLRGAGRAFSAGGDFDVLEQNARTDPETNRRRMLSFYRSYLSLLRVRVPTIAVLHGAAVGAGLCVAAACDVRIASDGAKLGANFVRVGLHPGMGCTVLLPRLVGAAKAAELMLGGVLVDGAEAARIGLVNRAVPADELEAAVRTVADSVLRGAPVAVAQTKASLVMPVLAELEAALEREATCQAISFATSDLREAITAFRAGRPPVFEGR